MAWGSDAGTFMSVTANAMVGRGNARRTTAKNGLPVHARTTHNGLLQKRLEEDLY